MGRDCPEPEHQAGARHRAHAAHEAARTARKPAGSPGARDGRRAHPEAQPVGAEGQHGQRGGGHEGGHEGAQHGRDPEQGGPAVWPKKYPASMATPPAAQTRACAGADPSTARQAYGPPATPWVAFAKGKVHVWLGSCVCVCVCQKTTATR